ncbi:MAG: bifunctional riboflavin kinase/FAD synthetase [Bacteroidales bacterium]|nr:bifunctional riboflavin kinase/FAD synthetase [Candidatus Latescibacterota bacterium]
MAEILTSAQIEDGRIGDSVVSIGVFDGVHIGHQKVIESLQKAKVESGANVSVLMTFDRHPLSVTHPERQPRLLTTLKEKLSILSELDVDIILVEEFTSALAAIDYRDFIETRLLRRLGMKHLVIGYDFHLGRGREGNQQNIAAEGKKTGYGFSVVSPVVVRGRAVSSTRIRKNIEARKLHVAARLLTRPYFFDADVVHGEGIGRELKFPTANATVSHSEKLLPPTGVYAVNVETPSGISGGMMNVGAAPTIRHDGVERIEVHLFDFDGNLYGERIRICCLDYLREEKEFDGRDELRAQLKRDRDCVRSILEKKY